MKVGVISDTHGLLRPEVFDVFAEVDHIVHAGDIGSTDLLVELETIAPVTAVFGNTDGFDVRQRCPLVGKCELEGLRVVVTHGDRFGTPNAGTLRTAFPDADILVYGHTHEPFYELYDYVVTVMNPGAAGHTRGGTPATVGLLDLEAGLPPRGRILPITS